MTLIIIMINKTSIAHLGASELSYDINNNNNNDKYNFYSASPRKRALNVK